VHRNEYRDFGEARAAIHEFLEKVYNRKRLHSALGHLPPAEFERNLATQNKQDAASRQLSLCVFQGIGKSIHPMEARSFSTTPPLIAWMSFRLVILDGLLSSIARLCFTNRFRVCCRVVLPVDCFSANGEPCLNHLCQPRGQAHLRCFGCVRSSFVLCFPLL
jgi:hypothetical protein